MPYMIDSGIWSSVFAVPAAVVDEHIKMCSPLSLKILLVMLRHPGMPVDAQWLSERLCISAADISDALNYWIGAGIVHDSGQPAEHAAPQVFADKTPPSPAVSEKRNDATGQRIVTIAARPKIGLDEIAQIAKTNSSVTGLLSEAQSILGAPLTPVESEILVALSTYYGMESDAVLMLLQYCVSIGHKSMHYVEKTAASWLEKGINTHERIEQEIVRLMRNNENEKKVIKVFGIYNRGLTPKEREFTARWFELGFDDALIFLACERAAENTGKVSFAYADKILSSWKEKGISSIRAAMDDLNSGKPAEIKQNKSAQTGGDSSIDMDKLRDFLHQQHRD